MTTRTAPEILLELSFANIAARALQVVAEAGVADALDGDPCTAERLAAETGLHRQALERLLRLLEERGIFRRDHEGRWSHTEASRFLCSDHPASLRSFAWMAGTRLCWESVTHLDHTARTGEAGIRLLDPDGTFSYLANHPDESRIFQAAMSSKAHADVAAALDAHDFSRYASVCDIGGGQGHFLRAILDSHHDVQGLLFELPEVARTVTTHIRMEVVAGDFFADQLPDADAYVLMDVLHDWDDRAAIRILHAVAQAGRARNSAVLILEAVMPEGPEPHWSKTLDVLMLATTGGRERTLAEYVQLFATTGIELISMTPTTTPFSVVEARVT